MDKFNNVIEFCKNKYKILIPFMVGFVLLITVYFLYKEYQYDNYRNKEEVLVFQNFGGEKEEYTAIVTYNLKNSIVDLTAKDKKIQYDSSPVYYVDEDKVLFPSEMSIVFPLKDGSQFKLYKYSTCYFENDLHMIKSNTESSEFDYFFLYDGKNLFFFPDEVEIKLNDKVYKKLGAMSYISVVGGYTLNYYDTATDTAEIIELNGRSVSVSGKHIDINVKEKYFMALDKKVLLFSPDNLNPVHKID